MTEITQARMHDIPRMAQILWAFTRQTEWLPVKRSRLSDLHGLAQVTHRGWVRSARRFSSLSAFIARDGDLIHALAVHPGARGQGLGAALIDDAKQARDRLELFTPRANLSARSFYERKGFREVASGVGLGNDENLADVHLIWSRSGAATDA